MKKVFLTGANGVLGKSILDRWKDKYEIFKFLRGESLEIIKSINPDYVIHAAADIYNTDNMFESNIKLTYDLLKLSSEIKVKKFVYVGSSSEYGRKSRPMSEIDLPEPDSLYEGTKLCGTILTRVFNKSLKLPSSVVRPFSLYGIHESNHKLIPILYECFKKSIVPNLTEGNHDYIHMDDFIDGLELVMIKDEPFEIYNLGTGIQTTNIQIFNIFSNIFKSPLEYRIVNKSPKITASVGIESPSWLADISKAKKNLNWCPGISIEDGLKRYIFERNTIE